MKSFVFLLLVSLAMVAFVRCIDNSDSQSSETQEGGSSEERPWGKRPGGPPRGQGRGPGRFGPGRFGPGRFGPGESRRPGDTSSPLPGSDLLGETGSDSPPEQPPIPQNE